MGRSIWQQCRSYSVSIAFATMYLREMLMSCSDWHWTPKFFTAEHWSLIHFPHPLLQYSRHHARYYFKGLSDYREDSSKRRSWENTVPFTGICTHWDSSQLQLSEFFQHLHGCLVGACSVLLWIHCMFPFLHQYHSTNLSEHFQSSQWSDPK